MNDCGQEMTLQQFVETLSESHLARKEYNSLIEDLRWLQALKEAGVDNWEGCGFAAEILSSN